MSILSTISKYIKELAIELRSKTFASLVDVDAENAEPNDVLIYANGKWTADSSSIFGLIDGGYSDANYTEALNIDGGSA